MVVLCKGYTVTWIDLYFLEGLLMHRQEFEMKEDNGNTLEPLKLLLSSIHFLLAALITAIISSAVVFAL
jgi:hypothetical protein